jgi:hypothetical protein
MEKLDLFRDAMLLSYGGLIIFVTDDSLYCLVSYCEKKQW